MVIYVVIEVVNVKNIPYVYPFTKYESAKECMDNLKRIYPEHTFYLNIENIIED